MKKTYTSMMKFKSFDERYRYLKTNSEIFSESFGANRYLNQSLYKSKEWIKARNKVIFRDDGFDLGSKDRKIDGKIIVHHINPITEEQILNRDPDIFNPDNLISCSEYTHKCLHFGKDESLLEKPKKRFLYDTCPWKKRR